MKVGFISSSYKAVDVFFIVWVLMREQAQMYVQVHITSRRRLKSSGRTFWA